MTAMEIIKEYAILNDNVWLVRKLELAELEIEIKTMKAINKQLYS